LAILAAYLIVRYVIVKPLKHLRDVSDAVSRGNLEQRAEIQTADEFEELALAFNRMLASLITAQEELRRLNSNLDLKVDELAQANMRLFELNRLKSDFLATMSHELRTPLNSIIGFSDVLSSIKSLDEKQRRYVQNIQKSGKMLLDMINDILDLAKIEAGRWQLEDAEIDLHRLAGDALQLVTWRTKDTNAVLENAVDPALEMIFADERAIKQILVNLLSNAVKFTPENGRVCVFANRITGGGLTFGVSDTGIGISAEDQQKVFDSFGQGKHDVAIADKGTGLGLAIVKGLAESHGGRVMLESQVGKGTKVTVHLPATRVRPRRREIPELAHFVA
jgi:signal transduction histidine kinase